ncbi:hypothetical protein HPP92_023412 [Vanilla planifolia]|uniref:ZF-HD dimerization-type domain-containing protein n=1 Tax=Vanilla planifolia TaxID=51239 RepID=A0A835PQB3_VANPL|nr:hypothetical protein HPP92_023412 [Vanilla planifolia]
MSISSSPGRAAPFSRAASTKASASSASEGALKYRECLKNHAASIGGHVVDGCGEFMPSNDDIYKCAACSCHRSFHRKDSQPLSYYCTSTAHGGRGRLPLLLPPPPAAYRHHPKPIGFQSTPPIGGNTSLSGGTTTESSSEEQMGVVDTQLQPTLSWFRGSVSGQSSRRSRRKR